jgi:hypothetical protein
MGLISYNDTVILVINIFINVATMEKIRGMNSTTFKLMSLYRCSDLFLIICLHFHLGN